MNYLETWAQEAASHCGWTRELNGAPCGFNDDRARPPCDACLPFIDGRLKAIDAQNAYAVDALPPSGARAALLSADSLLSLLLHRYRSRLPASLHADIEETYLACRREAEKAKNS